ncbi:hypothetical protein [Robertmurraya sp. FSL R5-0851]|uniref:hypothetical protein n=1 Tax=Robertmurraya sp. FSL R5-0851 TaxID=2921584 RepID=UPI0030F84E86
MMVFGKKFSIKLLISSVLLGLTLCIAPINSHAARTTDCTTGVLQCRGVYLERGDQAASTTSLYFSKGSVITYGAKNNYSTLGQFQVSVNLWRTSPLTKVASQIVPFGGDKTFYFPVSESGNYAVVLQSGDSSQGRSYAFGWLKE